MQRESNLWEHVTTFENLYHAAYAVLRARLNEGKSRIRQVKEGIEFLGFVVLPNHLRLNQATIQRQRKRLRRLQEGYANRLLRLKQVVASLQAWNAHAAQGTTWRLRTEVFHRTVFVA